MFPRNKQFQHEPNPVLQGLDIEQYNSKPDNFNGRLYFIGSPTFSIYPSVTTVLKHLTESHIEKWKERVGEEEAAKVSDKASSRGNIIHEMCEMYLNNENFKLSMREDFKPHKYSFDQLKPILNNIDRIQALETGLYSHKLRMAGRVDCIGYYDGVLSVIDFKTSKKTKKREWIEHYFIQETAYALMYQELTGTQIRQIVTIISTDDGIPQVFVEDAAKYYEKIKIAVNTFQKLHEKELVYVRSTWMQ